jgi:hypothetical protein
MGDQSIRVLLASSSLRTLPSTYLISMIATSQKYFVETMFLYTTQYV